jgi:hypothetical protein
MANKVKAFEDFNVEDEKEKLRKDKIESTEEIDENIGCENSGQIGHIQFYNQWRLPNEMSFGVAEK